MKVRTFLTISELTDIADKLNMKLNNFKTIKHDLHQFTLRPKYTLKQKKIENIPLTIFLKFRGKGYCNKFSSTCLHGYTAFMIAVLEKDINAKFMSTFGLVTIDNIENKYYELKNKEIGSIINPSFYGDHCHCDQYHISEIENKLKNIKRGRQV